MWIESRGVAIVISSGVDQTGNQEVRIATEGTDIKDDILSFILINKTIIMIRLCRYEINERGSYDKRG
jgi:hypothetical protein